MAGRTAFLDGRVPKGVGAFGVTGAGIKHLAGFGFAFQYAALVTLRAVNAGISGLFQGLDMLAFGIAAATDKFAVAPGFDGQWRLADGTKPAFHDFRFDGRAVVIA